jgi:hypothetical protein
MDKETMLFQQIVKWWWTGGAITSGIAAPGASQAEALVMAPHVVFWQKMKS